MRGQTIRIGVEDTSQTAEARRTARGIAHDIGFDEEASERVAIGVTEACTNILKHAERGEVLVSVDNEGSALEMLALDRGPGMGNLEQCLQDGFSTGGSPGQGLGAIRRLSAASDFYSMPGGGAAVLARWSAVPSNGSGEKPRGRTRIGAVNVCKRGETVCGDAWGAEETEQTTTVLVADGLGHGPDARAASLEAVRMLHLNPDANADGAAGARSIERFGVARSGTITSGADRSCTEHGRLCGSGKCVRAHLLRIEDRPAAGLGERYRRT